MKILRNATLILLLTICALVAPVLWKLTSTTTEAQSAGYNYVNISTASTTQVSPTSIWFHTLVLDGGNVGTITIYDSASGCSGTKISTISTSAPPVTLIYDIQTKNGLCVNTSTSMDATVSFR
jgi:hypothetical protein